MTRRRRPIDGLTVISAVCGSQDVFYLQDLEIVSSASLNPASE